MRINRLLSIEASVNIHRHARLTRADASATEPAALPGNRRRWKAVWEQVEDVLEGLSNLVLYDAMLLLEIEALNRGRISGPSPTRAVLT